MATIIYAEGWEHRSLTVDDFAQSDGVGIADFIAASANVTVVQTNPRSGASCLRVAPAGASTGPEKNVPGTDPAISVVGVGVRFETSLPAASSQIFIVSAAAGGDGRLEYNSATSRFRLNIVGGGASDIGPTLVADQWYWVDLKLDVSGGTRTLDGAIDEGANTQVTLVVAASTINLWKHGTDTTNTYAARYDDFVASNTAADYPLGKKKVLGLFPNGDGTHVISGAGDFDKADGTDILSSTTDAWTEIDDWITGATDTTTHILDLAGASTEYTEHTFDDTTEGTIDAVMGAAAVNPISATAHRLTVRLVNSAGSTVAEFLPTADFDISTAVDVIQYACRLLSTNPTQSVVNGYKVRIGLSTDVAPDPRFTAVMLQIVVPEAAAGQTATYAVAAETDSALAFGTTKLASYGIAAEVDSALSFIADRLILYGVTVETDTALSFGTTKLASYGIAAEADSALSFLADRLYLYGIASEVDSALAFDATKAVVYGVAVETDSALAFTVAKLASYGIAIETDAALSFIADRLIPYGIASEADVALAFIHSKLAQYGIAPEVDAALAFIAFVGGGPPAVLYGTALEQDMALPFDIKTARILEGFEISGGPFGPGVNKKRKRFAVGKGRAMP